MVAVLAVAAGVDGAAVKGKKEFPVGKKFEEVEASLMTYTENIKSMNIIKIRLG